MDPLPPPARVAVACLTGDGVKSPTCPECGKVCATYRGRRVHQRRTHQDNYHVALSEELDARPRMRWDPEEDALMAEFERDHQNYVASRSLNFHIKRELLQHRTLDAIKSRRRQPAYRRVLQEMQGDLPPPPNPPQSGGTGAPRVSARTRRRENFVNDYMDLPVPPGMDPVGFSSHGMAGERRRNSSEELADVQEEPEAEAGTPVTSHTSSEDGFRLVVDGLEQPEALVRSITEEPESEVDERLTVNALATTVAALSERLAIEVPCRVDDIKVQLDEWLPPRPPRVRPQRRPGRRTPDKRRLRRQRFAVFQKEYLRARGRAVKRILNEEDLLTAPELPEGSSDFWKDLFERPSPEEFRDPSPVNRIGPEVMGPITEEELKIALFGTSKSTAPGPDGRSHEALKELGVNKLLWVMNSVLLLGTLPKEWLVGRTVLIAKKNNPITPGDLRPITITPLITRLTHKVLARRVSRAAPLPKYQKGFKEEEGCAANIVLLRAMIKQAQTKPSNLYVAWVDFKKAFDSVGHPSLIAACKRWGFPTRLTEYIERTYDQAATHLPGQNTPTKFRRGVLQGDPLSPFLFNISLDWALSAMPQTIGGSLGEGKLPYLAFADDVAVFASTRPGLRVALERLTSAARLSGLEIGVEKCATLGIVVSRKKSSWALNKSPFNINGQNIKAMGPRDFYRYLGIRMGADLGGTAHLSHKSLSHKLGLLQKAPARPQQKLWGLQRVVVPQFLYPLVNADPTKGQLERLDKAVRRSVRAIMHWPRSAPLGLFYAKVVDGGLGITNYVTSIPRLRSNLLQRLECSDDQSVRHAVAISVGGGTVSPDRPEDRRQAERDGWSKRLYSAVDGRGLRGVHLTPVSSSWVDDGTQLLTGRNFIQGVKLRSNLLCTKARTARGREARDNACNLCHAFPETLGHILQRCDVTQRIRITRHDKMVKWVISRLQSAGYQTLKEPQIRTSVGTRIPDIIATRPGAFSYVLDVQVVQDASAGSLQSAHDFKVKKYNNAEIKEWVLGETGFTPTVEALTCSWRGVVSPATVAVWKKLGLRTADLKIFVIRAIEGGNTIYSTFNRIGGSYRPHPG